MSIPNSAKYNSVSTFLPIPREITESKSEKSSKRIYPESIAGPTRISFPSTGILTSKNFRSS
jgi:hypothetical protein